MKEILILLCFLIGGLLTTAFGQTNDFVNFEGRTTSPLRLSPDGSRLFVVNTPDARLSVFSLSNPSSPGRIAEIPVGIEPVSVHARSNEEAWVVNEISDSVSVVSVAKKIVLDTIRVGDEPADIVFAQNKAFVSISRANAIVVLDAITHAKIATIALKAENPRALAVSKDGKKVYVAFALSGNRTTLIPADFAPPQPPPTNHSLPPAPQTGLIVSATNSSWSSIITWSMPDWDVAEIDAVTHKVLRYFSQVGTINLGLSVNPASGDIYVANTHARNLVRFETALRGRPVDSRITRISVTNGSKKFLDLNPGLNYGILPNPTHRAKAISQPTSIAFHPAGTNYYVASYGTDIVASVHTNGTILSRLNLGPSGSTAVPQKKKGTRALAYLPGKDRLYVYNRISNTFSIVDTLANKILGERNIGAYNPTPEIVKRGRGFLYDAKLSGNGTASCSSCHVDGDLDLIAWDLGNPGGQMDTVNVVTNFNGATAPVPIHPMKGPMTTQTLKGLKGMDPLHWRGDRATFDHFNGAFDSLLGGSTLVSTNMNAFRDFVETLTFGPNPNQKLDRTLPTTLNGGDPLAGQHTFLNETFAPGLSCATCHELPTGSNGFIIPAQLLQESQPFKVPHLRNIYAKLGMSKQPGASSRMGFGIAHDGVDPDIFTFLSRPVFGSFANDTTRKQNLAAFVASIDTGTAPSVGFSMTLNAARIGSAFVQSDWNILESQAALGNCDLILKGTLQGTARGLKYDPANQRYLADKSTLPPFTRTQLQSFIASGDTLTLMGVPPGSGLRMGIDRDRDGILDGDE
jgi:YVTN family beta-propeller protein